MFIPSAQALDIWGMGTYAYRERGDAGTRDTMLGHAVDLGAGWVREEFTWSTLETSKGSYDNDQLAQYDALVAAAKGRGLQILGLIAYNNSWSSGDNAPSETSQFQDFADFVTFLVKRYKGQINHWQIWNEPNTSSFWKPEPSAAQYAALLKYAYQAAKAVDGGATIVGMGTAGIDLPWMEEFCKAGGQAYMDVAAAQPYPHPSSLEASDYWSYLHGMRELLSASGFTGPIWFTELGYSTYNGDYGVSYGQQSRFLVRSFLAANAFGVERLFWYDLRNDGTSDSSRVDNFGVLYRDMSPKASYTAMQTMTSLVGGANLVGNYTQGGAWCLEYEANGQKILVLWLANSDDSAGSQTATINLSGSVSQALNVYGAGYDYDHSGDTLTITMSVIPVYVLGDFTCSGFENAPSVDNNYDDWRDKDIPGVGSVGDVVDDTRSWFEDNFGADPEEVWQDIQDGVDDVGDAVDDAVDDVTDAVEDVFDDLF